MSFKVGYDMDGVLAVQPPDTGTPWRKMNGEQRKAKQRWLVEWYRNAKPILMPKEEEFIVITARKNTEEIRGVTLDWLGRRFPGRNIKLEMLQESRNIENVVKFKSGIIQGYGLTDYTEDNKVVVKALRGLKLNCRIWLFADEQQILDYNAPLGI